MENNNSEPLDLLRQETQKERSNNVYNIADFVVAEDDSEDSDFELEENLGSENAENSGGDTETNEDEKPEKKKRKKDKGNGEPSGVVEKSAATGANLIKMIIEKGCALYASEPQETFQLTEKDNEDLRIALSNFLEETGMKLNPAWAFFGSVTMIGGYYGFKAHEIKVKKEKLKRRVGQIINEPVYAENPNLENTRTFSSNIQTSIPAPPPKIHKGRRQFNVHANGYYSKNEGGEAVSVETATEKAPDWILKEIREGKARGESMGTINKYIVSLIEASNNV